MIQRVPRRGDRTGVPRFGLVPDPGRRDYPDGGIRGRAWGVDVGGLSGLPGSATWPPARYRPPVFVVPRAEPALQLRLLQPVDPGDQRERDETRVPQQVCRHSRIAWPRIVASSARYMGLRTYRYRPPTTRCAGGATGAGVPSPSTTNRA